jgi:hypothetical protein
MNENKHPYSLGHRGMKGDHKDEKGCHAIQDSLEGKNLGKGVVGGRRMEDVETLGFKKPQLKLVTYYMCKEAQIFERLSIKINY